MGVDAPAVKFCTYSAKSVEGLFPGLRPNEVLRSSIHVSNTKLRQRYDHMAYRAKAPNTRGRGSGVLSGQSPDPSPRSYSPECMEKPPQHPTVIALAQVALLYPRRPRLLAPVGALSLSVLLGHLPPRRSRPRHPEYAAEHSAVVEGWSAYRAPLRRQQGVHRRPLLDGGRRLLRRDRRGFEGLFSSESSPGGARGPGGRALGRRRGRRSGERRGAEAVGSEDRGCAPGSAGFPTGPEREGDRGPG
jgi:hypothetical protein